MRALTAILLILLASGCATTEADRAARIQRDVDDMVRVYGPGCEKLGYPADTDGWRDCVLRLATKNSIERREILTTNCIASRGFYSCSSY